MGEPEGATTYWNGTQTALPDWDRFRLITQASECCGQGCQIERDICPNLATLDSAVLGVVAALHCG